MFTWRHGGHVGGVNKETAAMLEEWNILLGTEFYFYANSSFCFIMQIWLLVTWANKLYYCQQKTTVSSPNFLMILFDLGKRRQRIRDTCARESFLFGIRLFSLLRLPLGPGSPFTPGKPRRPGSPGGPIDPGSPELDWKKKKKQLVDATLKKLFPSIHLVNVCRTPSPLNGFDQCQK